MSSLGAYRAWDRTVEEAEHAVAHSGEVLVESISTAMHAVTDQLVAVGGLYNSSDVVTRAEFTSFVRALGVHRGVTGIAYAPVVTPDEVPGFLVAVRTTIPDYEIYTLDSEGQRRSLPSGRTHVPLQWVEPDQPGASPHGLDLASIPVLADTLATARETGNVAATPFLQLPGQGLQDSVVIVFPIIGPRTGSAEGYTVALIELGAFLEGHLPSALASTATWEVSDTPGDLTEPDHGWSGSLVVAGDEWQIVVSGTSGTNTVADPSTALLVFGVGLVMSVLAAYGVSSYRQRASANTELQRLRDMSRAKDQFLASVGHELRTPLTGVVGFTELLRDPKADLTDEERERMIESISEDSSDLAAIIDDLLVAARSELDLVTVTAEPVDLSRLVQGVIDSIGDDKLGWVHEAEPGIVAIGDPGRIRQVVRNLLTNALRYGGDQIEIRLADDGGRVTLQVADSGPALPRESWEEIFETYFRVHDIETKPAALGIGLSVSRHLSRMMKGDLVYRHEAGWSVFELTLPAPTPPESDAGTSAASYRQAPRS